jgi:hypothetical protein
MTTDTRPAFTPGPWHVIPRGRMGFDVKAPEAELFGTRGMFAVRADADLAAAAPELYEALRDLTGAVDFGRESSLQVYPDTNPARNALAKARGE